ARLASAMIDGRGAAPRVVAWMLYLGVALAFLSWATFNGLRWLFVITNPNVTLMALPLVVVAATLAAAVLSRPLVDAIAAGLAFWEPRRAARGRRALVTPRAGAAVIAVGAAAILLVSWYASVRRRIGPFDLTVFVLPLVAVAACAALHAGWRRAPRARRP